MKKYLALLLTLTLLIACAPSPKPAPTAAPTQPPVIEATATPQAPARPWWRDAVFYEIFVRSFNDTDGDGIGDFNGITQKLDYLQSLGVTALWLMPIHPSPSYHGYDVINYYAVNAQYGSMSDFKTLLNESHKRGIRVVIDLVLNHTSAQHPWFAAANSSKASEYRDWYIWQPESAGAGWHAGNEDYYYGFFWGGMPDLNYRNPAVTEQMTNMSLWWLKEVGVDGFRIDAVKHLLEEDGKNENTPANYAWLGEFYKAYKAKHPEAYTIGEVFGAGGLLVKNYREKTDQIFNFELANGFVNSANGGSNTGIYSGLRLTLKNITDGDYAVFLTNHDQNRAMSVFNGDMGKAKAAAAMLMTSPGTVYLYYGEEIGMTGVKPDERIRTPMQWSEAVNAGFSSGVPWQAPNSDYAQGISVATQDKDPNSLLNHYRALVQLRHKYPIFKNGTIALLDISTAGLYAILRQDANETVLVLVNLKNETLGGFTLQVENNVLPEGSYSAETLFGQAQLSSIQVESGSLQGIPETLAPYETLIIRLAK